MNNRKFRHFLLAVATLTAGLALANRPSAAADSSVAALARETHFHGIAVDAADPSRIYLATHNGLYVVAPDGSATRVSTTGDDFMGFTPHPADPSVLYASGHPADGGNLGFVVSRDGGVSWTKLADGAGGPVDFHQMDASKADPKVVYGIYGDLQASRDGGRSWEWVGPAPEGIIALAASARDVRVLYAATKNGLLKSADGGRSWQAAYILRRPATMVHVEGNGEVYAFLIGSGLIRASEPGLGWQTVSNDFGPAYVLHLAADPSDARKLYAIALNPDTREEAVLASRDGGATWAPLGGGK